jgi:hypothetical protein
MDFAVVVGINDYPYYRDLKGPIPDAQEIYDWLIRENGGKEDKECYKLIISQGQPDPKPVYDQIDESFLDIFNYIDAHQLKNNRLYFYFSGHGLGVEYDDNALCLVKWAENRRGYSISTRSYVNEAMGTGRFNEILFFLDCCRNRKIAASGSEPSWKNVKPLGRANLFVAFGTEFQDAAYEIEVGQPGGEYRGIFTSVLLRGLNGESLNNGAIDTDYLKNFLIKNVPLEAQKYELSQGPAFGVTDSFVIKKLPSNQIISDVTIIINPTVGNTLAVFDGKADIIVRIDPHVGRTIKIPLSAGKYSIAEIDIAAEIISIPKYFTIDDNLQSHEFTY